MTNNISVTNGQLGRSCSRESSVVTVLITKNIQHKTKRTALTYSITLIPIQ